jgi:thiol-disulfide isomerase/thioredoxin
MSTKTPPRKNTRTAAKKPPPRRYPVVPVLIVGAVVIVAAAVLAFVLGGDDNGGDGGVAQTRTVTVEGTALPTFDDNPANDPAVGQAAPTLVGEDFSGKKVTIGDDGRAKAIMFVAHWCPHCQKEVPIVANYVKDSGLPTGVELFVVPTSTSSAAPNYPPSTWLENAGMGNVPTLVDDDHNTAHTAYGSGGFPNLVLVDKDGKVAARFSGELGEDSYPILFDALAKGEPIPGTSEGPSSATPQS